LFITADDIWTDPIIARAGEGATLGVNVRNGGNQPATNFSASFYVDGELLDTAPAIGPLSGYEYVALSTPWNPLVARTYHIQVVVNLPPPRLELTSLVAERDIVVLEPLSPGADTEPPVGDSLIVNDGSPSTAVREVALHLQAHDNSPAGVQAMLIKEFTLDPATQQWLVAQSSGWVDYTPVLSFTLSAGSVAKYLHAWFADGNNNVSLAPVEALINYIPSPDQVNTGEWRVYRWYLASGQRIGIVLMAQSGDPDLFVWVPGNVGLPDYWSMEPGWDMVSFLAPTTGVYQVQVYGYQAASYNFYLLAGFNREMRVHPDLLEANLRKWTGWLPWTFVPKTTKALPTEPLGRAAPPPRSAVGVLPSERHFLYVPAIHRQMSER